MPIFALKGSSPLQMDPPDCVFVCENDPISCLKIKGDHVYVGTNNGKLKTFDRFGNTVLAAEQFHDSVILDMQVSNDGKTIYMLGKGSEIFSIVQGIKVSSLFVKHFTFANILYDDDRNLIFAPGEKPSSIIGIDCRSFSVVKTLESQGSGMLMKMALDGKGNIYRA